MKPEDFTATQCSTKEDKQKFAKKFIAFVKSDFKESLFTKDFYNRLSMCFGHIAHYNREGFYNTWFSGRRHKIEFLKRTLTYGCHGDPAWTYSDVETYLGDHDEIRKALEFQKREYAKEIEKSEREQLTYLQEKYKTA